MTRYSGQIAELWDQVLAGRMNRRDVLRRAMAIGLTAPTIGALLAACSGDDDDDAAESEETQQDATADEQQDESSTATETESTEEATEAEGEATSEGTSAEGNSSTETAGQGRGAGDTLRILNWQAPTNLNPHFSQGYHNSAPARMVLEPLVSIDTEGNYHPVLIEEVPTLDNGGISADGKEITYTLLEGLVWSDGEPFTTEDVRFTWEWATAEGVTLSTIAIFNQIADVEIVDERKFIVKFHEPTPTWYNPFSRGAGLGGQVLPKHLMQDYMGPEAANAPFNLKPIGTGPYKIIEFKPGDLVTYEINELYREPDKPFFNQVELKGGGDAASAARAVLQTGDVDYAPNLQVEKTVLDQLVQAGAGELVLTFAGECEQIFINFADPNKEVNGAFAEPSTEHPFLTELPVRQALALATDRESIATQFYGQAGRATANVITAPEKFVSPNTSFEFNVEKAAQLLDEAGWTMEDGVRKKDGTEMQLLYQTSINTLRQKTQEVVKSAWEQIGIPTELKAIEASVFFSSDAGNPDTWLHFYADVEMATVTTGPYPSRHMRRWASVNPEEDIAQKANGWTGRNLNRWVNEEYNELFKQVRTELDPEKQVELFIKMNDIVVNDVVTIVEVDRANVAAKSNRLQGIVTTPWDEFTYDIANWYAEE